MSKFVFSVLPNSLQIVLLTGCSPSFLMWVITSILWFGGQKGGLRFLCLFFVISQLHLSAIPRAITNCPSFAPLGPEAPLPHSRSEPLEINNQRALGALSAGGGCRDSLILPVPHCQRSRCQPSNLTVGSSLQKKKPEQRRYPVWLKGQKGCYTISNFTM